MNWVIKTLWLLPILGEVLSVSLPVTHAVHEKRSTLPPRWVKRSRLASHNVLPMRISLVQNNLEDAHERLMQVSDPTYVEHYGKFWSSEEVVKHFQPSPESVDAVRNWLLSSGIESVTHSDNMQWLAFPATAAQAESLFHTEFHEYEDLRSGIVTPACDVYHIPKHIQKHVDFLKPGIHLSAPGTLSKRRSGSPFGGGWPSPPWAHQPHKPMSQNPSDLATCDVAITPACVASLYNIPPFTPSHKANPGNSLGIFESELQYWVQEDLDLFFKNFTPYIPQGTHPNNINIDGGVATTTNLSAAGGEAELDILLALPQIYPQSITLYNVDDLVVQADPNDTYTGGFNTFLDALDGSYCKYSAYGETGNDPSIDPVYPDLRPGGYKGQLQCGVYKPTNVISISYGGQEAAVPYAYQKRQCYEYLKLGLQGVSVLFASGDAGVADYPEPYGISGPTGCLGPKQNIFNPTWPNTCPYVTNVGATKVYPGKSVNDPESAVFDPAGHPYHVNFSSGGGFSNIYAIPDYQQKAVNRYLSEFNPPYPSYSGFVNDTSKVGYEGASATGGIYNRLGRGVPDVAANGDNIAVYVGGNFSLSGGTSASTPIFAAVVNRLIEERLAIGKGPVGFLNPLLYQNPWILNDIKNGSNPGCGTLGFEATEGWDPVTGLGTPDFKKMLSLFLRVP